MRFLYLLGTQFYFLAIWLAQPFSAKARLWVEGRQNWRSKLQQLKQNNLPLVWVHCASLGEFEQGRPLIEALKEQTPGLRILLTFFSPSGYEIRKNYPHADLVMYLPADGPGNARDFIALVQPKVAIFIKYEMWLFYLEELKRQQVHTLLVSANFQQGHRYGKGLQRRLFRRMLDCFQHVFAQNEATIRFLSKFLPPQRISLSGDTRFDRVYAIAGSFSPVPGIAPYSTDRFVVVCGSTWPPDEALIAQTHPLVSAEVPTLRWIIAPHLVDEDHLKQIEATLPGPSVRYSAFEDDDLEKPFLIIDNIGMLSRLYHYADLCWIGGGFGSGIHNTLEAAVFGQRVLFGPKHERFQEALDLVRLGGAAVVTTPQQLAQEIRAGYQKQASYQAALEASKRYVEENTGATELILEYLHRQNLLQEETQLDEIEDLQLD